MRRKSGFTLVELLVVITIIVLLLALLASMIQGMVEKARNTKTAALIKILDEGCQRYKTETNSYPPMAPYSDSRCLHYYLGKELQIPTGRDRETGNPTGWKKLPPIVQFKADQLDLPAGRDSLDPVLQPPVPVIDAWGKAIQYRPYPGQRNPTFVDIWSRGKEDSIEEDDITNWNKEL